MVAGNDVTKARWSGLLHRAGSTREFEQIVTSLMTRDRTNCESAIRSPGGTSGAPSQHWVASRSSKVRQHERHGQPRRKMARDRLGHQPRERRIAQQRDAQANAFSPVEPEASRRASTAAARTQEQGVARSPAPASHHATPAHSTDQKSVAASNRRPDTCGRG